jgi:HAD superfamily hydrolase (TIGR01549 family)
VLIKDFSGNNKWDEMKRDLGVTPETDEAFEAAWETIDDRVCVDYDVDGFTDIIRTIPGIRFPKQYSMLDDFVNRFELFPSVWPLVESLATHYPIGLLTNMYPRMLDKIFEKELVLKKFFTTIIDSSVVGFKKPQQEIFTLAQKSAGAEAQQILFIDNSLENVEASQNLGWQTFHFDPKQCNASLKSLQLMINNS